MCLCQALYVIYTGPRQHQPHVLQRSQNQVSKLGTGSEMEPPKHCIRSYKGNQPGHVCSFIIKGAFAENQNSSFPPLTRKWGLGIYHIEYCAQSTLERFGLTIQYVPSVVSARLGPLSTVTLLVLGDSSQVESPPP